MTLNSTATDGPDEHDQVSRQRRRRAQRLLDSPVAGFDEMTLHEVVISAMVALDESHGSVDLERFLVERGHVWQTVEVVQEVLATFHREPWTPASPPRP